MLGDFFRINFPYGLKRNDKDEWMLFNREYSPIGFNIYSYDLKYIPIELVFVKYKGLTNELLIQLSQGGEKEWDGDKITRIWLYNDSTAPVNSLGKLKPKLMSNYFKKLELLATLKSHNGPF